MRAEFCHALMAHAARPDFVFLTGDLGFMALEELREAMGQRFINAGVAEQNMVSVAAGMAREGFEVWAYSIAPFLYARPFEQIRNDVCMHGLDVRLVGNGGGYGYGVMGPTHHALEDYGVLLSLPGMNAYLPAFAGDVHAAVERARVVRGPAYLRLGRFERPPELEVPPYASWRLLLDGSGPVFVAAGPVASIVVSALETLPPDDRPEVWIVTELPLRTSSVPKALIRRFANEPALCVIEEHVAHGGLGAMMTLWLADQGISFRKFRHLCAKGYPSGRYGSQTYHRRESGLDPDSIRAVARELAHS